MNFLEKFVDRLSVRVNKQLDDLGEKQAFEAAQDANVAKDYKTALIGFEELAEKGHIRAATLAGGMYIAGDVVKENGAKALKYLTIGAEAGDIDAIALLGMAYAAGKAGIKVDFFKARPLLEIAVKNGDKQALHMLELVKGKQRRAKR